MAGRLAAVMAPHSGDWLLAFSITSCGLRLDDESVRMAVGMCLGINLCELCVCSYGFQVDARGLHGLGLMCKLAPGGIARQQSFNKVVSRVFASAGIPATKERTVSARGDDKRPNGMTLVTWQFGKPLTWDVTVVHTLADSYVSCTSRSAGAAAKLADFRKSAKYGDLFQSCLFQPTAVEILDYTDLPAAAFFSDLGSNICSVAGDAGRHLLCFRASRLPCSASTAKVSYPLTTSSTSHSGFIAFCFCF